ncbi:MAG TPA: glycogen-binding domain-containing protein [Planctomycetota bacterium]|nr:glycogen-binding domain-containing protein [Planctomycetota bacterium]
MVIPNIAQKQPKTSRKSTIIAARLPGAQDVRITGDFSKWSEEGIEMSHESGDLWEVELSLAAGEYQYRLRVDGRWQDHPEAKNRVPNPFGSENCVLRVS